MRFDRDTLGPYLYRERERRGITLDAISAKTKIARAHLVRLERGDVSEWPAGIFRRAFFREYVTAIGLDADDLLPEFLRLFPDPASTPGEASAADRSADALRLTLADPATTGAWRKRLLAAAIDSIVIVTLAGMAGLAVGHVATVVAIVAVVYQAVATAAGATIGMWLTAPVTIRFGRRSAQERSLPASAMMSMSARAMTTAPVTASDSHQTHGSFAHQAPVIR